MLQVENLSVEYHTARGTARAVRGVSFDLRAGETLALIGESGCGKTTLGLALTRLLPAAARITEGRVRYTRDFHTIDIFAVSPAELAAFRWQECAIVFQSALNALNPVLRVRDHFLDTARAHGQHDRTMALRRAANLLELVRLDARRVLDSYPHELSGGMRQRALLALAVLLDPQVLILDEPTTALDILTQRTVIDSLKALQASRGFAVLFISHDLALAAEVADRVATMYAGKIVETGPVDAMFYRPRHPYTLGLLRAVPTISGAMRELDSIPGSPPDLVSLPSGCAFHPRCPYADATCRMREPQLEITSGDAEHTAACFHSEQVRPEDQA